MLRIARFIKPFLGAISLAFLLLFVQALCDLNLPNLMSNIVNVGIQQGGVEDRSPRALSSEGMDLSRAFMTEEERAVVDEHYELVFPSDTAPDGKPWSEQYPDATDEGFYILNADVDKDARAQLDEIFGLSTWTMVYVLQEVAANGVENLGVTLPSGVGGEYAAGEGIEAEGAGTGAAGGAEGAETTRASDNADLSADIQNIDFSAIYDALPLIQMIPEDVMATYQAKASKTDEMMRNESATMLTRNLYTELGVDMAAYEIGYIVRVGLVMLLITLIGGAATVLVALLSSRAGAGMARDMRSAIFNKVLAFSHTEFDRFSTASLITRSTNDVMQIQTVVTLGIRMIFYAPIMGVGAVIMALQKSVDMSWILGVAALFMLCMVGTLMAIVLPKFKIIQKLIDRLNLVARETLNGQMVIRAFSRAPFEMERFDKANVDVTRTNLFIQRAMVFMMPVLMIFMNALTVLIVWIGSEQVAASQMQVGDMMAYMQYAMMMVMSFMFIAMAFIFVPRAMVSAGRIAEVLDTNPVIIDPDSPVVIPADLPAHNRGKVEFKDVSFTFENADYSALEHINFVAEPGCTTAIIGSTGSGKSTMLNLIPRFYDVDEGTVLFDGVDVRQLSIHDLRSRIGYVPQKSLLMSGTVAENIAYGDPDISEEQLIETAAVAQASDFISKLEGTIETEDVGEAPEEASSDTKDTTAPETEAENGTEPTSLPSGFDFEIAQGGGNVSGGQRQRLAIARALAVKPEVFLFDDSFSALDFATDAALRKALSTYIEDATLIIVAQRVGTIMDAQSIYVVDEGKIIGQGTHAELLKNCPAYREIAESQLSPEELIAAIGGDVK